MHARSTCAAALGCQRRRTTRNTELFSSSPLSPPDRSRATTPLQIPDLSSFARTLARELAARQAQTADPPGHVETLKLVARALGCRNLQALQAGLRQQPPTPSDDDLEAPPLPLSDHAQKALTQFDRLGAWAAEGGEAKGGPTEDSFCRVCRPIAVAMGQKAGEKWTGAAALQPAILLPPTLLGRLMRWPHKRSVQRLAMWVLWTHFDAKRRYSEKEVNAILREAHLFFDHATLRRELINHQLMARESDCSAYWKLPARPDDETRALLSAWRRRSRGLPGQRPALAPTRSAN